jgi:hypothetical protein
MITHGGIRQPDSALLVYQPRQDAPRGMTLLLGRIQVTAQHCIDRCLKRLQRLAHRAPVQMMRVR